MNNLKKISLFLIIFLILVSYSYLFINVHIDEIWNYGFSYNIANGLIPYKDFNMIILPFYQLILALFFKIFGSNLIVYHLINAFFITAVLYFIHKKIGILNTFCLILYILLMPIAYGYNTFISILLILILYLEDSNFKYKNLLIGLLIGAILMTKINLGIFIFLPYFIKSKEKLKSILYILIIPILILLYLLVTNSLVECIDYCFLGLSNFQDNLNISLVVLIIELIIIGYLLFLYFKTKDKKCFYLILFQGICYPLCDFVHFLIGLPPLIYYLLTIKGNYHLKLGIRIFIFVFFMMIVISSIMNDFYLSNRDTFLKYRRFSEIGDKSLEKIENYIKDNSDKRIFIFSYLAYTIKLDLDETLDKYDLINKGNMGSNENKYIEEIDNICKNEDCLFIMDLNEFEPKGAQTSTLLRDYVLENYELCDSITSVDKVYCKNPEQ